MHGCDSHCKPLVANRRDFRAGGDSYFKKWDRWTCPRLIDRVLLLLKILN